MKGTLQGMVGGTINGTVGGIVGGTEKGTVKGTHACFFEVYSCIGSFYSKKFLYFHRQLQDFRM